MLPIKIYNIIYYYILILKKARVDYEIKINFIFDILS